MGLNKKVSKVISLYTEAEFRTRDDVGSIDCWSLYGEISARICPYLKAGAGYTFIEYNHPDLSWEMRHRINCFLTANYSIGAWNFSVRERYEQVHRILAETSLKNTPKRTLRSRIECNYQITKSIFTPYATVELYTSLNTLQGVKNDKMRYTLGTQIALASRYIFSVYYRYIDMVQGSSANSHILGLGFKFNL